MSITADDSIADIAGMNVLVELYECEPGKWRVLRPYTPPARSDLPFPNVISDEMPPTGERK